MWTQSMRQTARVARAFATCHTVCRSFRCCRTVPCGPAFILMDEPEAVLSPQPQPSFLMFLHELVTDNEDIQFAIATHSPILLAYPGKQIRSLMAVRFSGSIVNGLQRRRRSTQLGDEAAARATRQFQCVGHNVRKRFRLRSRQGNVDQRRHHSHQRPLQNKMGFDPPTRPERSQEAHDEGSGGSGVVQEILAEM